MIYAAAAGSEAFSTLLKNTARRLQPAPMAPWKMLLYLDEISPGNHLAYKHARKTWGVYWSILEFGAAALSEEELWFEVALLRTDIVKHIQGGVGALIKAILAKGFFDQEGYDMGRTGVQLQLYDGPPCFSS